MKKIAVILIAVINIAAFYYGAWRIDYEILMPGGITEVEDKVHIDLEEQTQEGSFHSVFVYALDRPTRYMTWLGEQLYGVDVEEMYVTSTLLTNSQLKERGELLYDTGIEYSLIYAYEAADAEIKYFLEYISVMYYDPSLNDLDIGLEITGINGVDFESYTSFVTELVESEQAILNTTTGDYEVYKTDGKYGITISPNYKIYEAIPEYVIEKSNISGSSGGLLQTLSIFNQLTEIDYTYGYKITGTGTISTNGYVGPIGGVKQKVIAADREDAFVFFVPSANYDEAIEAKEEMNLSLNIVSVETFEDAVRYLEEVGASID